MYKNDYICLMKMLRAVLLLILCLGAIEAISQVGWRWATIPGAEGSSQGNDIVTDKDGNSYVIGTFSGLAGFRPTVYLTATGGDDIFLVKYNSSGTVIWEKKLGSTGNEVGAGIVVDDEGNLIIAGEFTDTTLLDNHQLVSRGGKDVFVAKCDTNGIVIWAASAGSIDNDRLGLSAGGGLCVDHQGYIYFTGNYTGSLHLDSATVNSVGSVDGYYAKLNSAGKVQWLKSVGYTGERAAGTDIIVDSFNNIYLAGLYSGVIYIDTIKLKPSISLEDNFFVTRLDSNGSVIWARSPVFHGQSGGGGYGGGGAVPELNSAFLQLDTRGNPLVAGHFGSGQIAFPGLPVLQANGAHKANFLVKYSRQGDALWARDLINAFSHVFAFKVDRHNDIYLSGGLSASVVIGSISLTGPGDFYIAKYDSSATVIWAKKGGYTRDELQALSTTDDGTVYTTGYLGGANSYFDNINLSNNSGKIAFAAQLSPGTTGISGLQQQHDARVYPNPANTDITINAPSNISQLAVIDITGRVVLTEQFTDAINTAHISTTNFNNGFYVLKIVTRQGVVSVAVIIAH